MSFSANRLAYCPRPSFSSQSATCCIAAPSPVVLRASRTSELHEDQIARTGPRRPALHFGGVRLVGGRRRSGPASLVERCATAALCVSERLGRSGGRQGPVRLAGDLPAPSGGPPESRPRHCRPTAPKPSDAQPSAAYARSRAAANRSRIRPVPSSSLFVMRPHNVQDSPVSRRKLADRPPFADLDKRHFDTSSA